MPQSCVTAQRGNLSAKSFINCGGAMEPETIASSSEDQSYLSNAPAARHAATCAGAVHSAVGFSFSAAAPRSSGLNAGRRTVLAPTAHAQCSEYRPYRCESGAAQSTRLFSWRPCSGALTRPFPSIVRYGCTTPFGAAVVPDV